MGLSNLRIYGGATRLLTITNYKGYDPSPFFSRTDGIRLCSHSFES